MEGKVHLYCGEGKGKTTCAAGLALRMLAAGGKVVIVQFLKDGASGEMRLLRQMPDVTFFADYPSGCICRDYTAEEQATLGEKARRLLGEGERAARATGARMLVLDEICGAVRRGLLPEQELLELLARRPDGLEVVLTGRKPSPGVLACADYVTEMTCRRHPFASGLPAREGIEW